MDSMDPGSGSELKLVMQKLRSDGSGSSRSHNLSLRKTQMLDRYGYTTQHTVGGTQNENRKDVYSPTTLQIVPKKTDTVDSLLKLYSSKLPSNHELSQSPCPELAETSSIRSSTTSLKNSVQVSFLTSVIKLKSLRVQISISPHSQCLHQTVSLLVPSLPIQPASDPLYLSLQQKACIKVIFLQIRTYNPIFISVQVSFSPRNQ